MELSAPTVLQGAATLCYGAGSAVAWFDVARPARRLGLSSTLAAAAGLLATVAALSWRSLAPDPALGRLWIATADEALLALAAGVAFVFVWLSFDRRFRAADALFLPALFVIALAAWALQIVGGSQARIGPGVLMAAHMLAIVGAAVAATSGFVGGWLYLLHSRMLASRAAGSWLGRLPALETLEHFNYRAAAAGFPLLTIGVVTGFVAFGGRLDQHGLADSSLGPAAWLKILMALTVWIVYGAIMAFIPRFRARLVARLNIATLPVLLAALLIARFAFTH